MRKIRIEPSRTLLAPYVPGYLWRQAPFAFDPLPFGLESDRLKEKIIEEQVQLEALATFTEDPKAPMIYAVAGNPDDSKALLFAAYLCQLHLKHAKNHAQIVWHSVNGSFKNPMLQPEHEPSMIVLSNISPVATGVKLDKVRDIVEKYQDIPRVLVLSGEDPLSFMMTRLYLPVHGIAYFCEALIKRKLEIL